MAANDDPRIPGGVHTTTPEGEGATGPVGDGVAAGGVGAGGVGGVPSGVPPEALEGVGSGRLGGTRTAHAWGALAAGMFFLVVVLVFILENLRSVKVHFFGATWDIPLAVDLLLATVLGALIMFAAGSLRIMQLRRAAKRGGRR